MKINEVSIFLFGILISFTLESCISFSAESKKSISADTAIESIKTLGFIDIDGSKTYAIVVKYGVDLTGANIGIDSFAIEDYGMSLDEDSLNLGDKPGVALAVYVNNEPTISTAGGTGTGSYVIIEVNTDYQVSRFARSWEITMAAGVTQVKTINTATKVILPSTKKKINYEVRAFVGYDPMKGIKRDPEYYNYAIKGTYAIKGLEGYKLHTIEAGTAFHATKCYDEANGKYWNFDLPYALYVPEDYNPSLKYALILHIHDAGSMSSNPMLTLTEAQGPSNFASDEFQQLAKNKGLAGAIVVCPAIAEFFNMDDKNPAYELRMVRDNYTLSCACPATWELMDSLTATYNIDTNRIYGSGQSMGGMTVMAMAAQRDNYFAAIMPMSCVWGSNFNKEEKFAGKTYFNAPADGKLVWNVDAHGNACDYNNWYYLISDDNMLYLNTSANPEYTILYNDLCGVKAVTSEMVLGNDTTADSRNALVKELVARDNKLGIYYVALSGKVGHMSAWFYGHSTFACYEWLMNQTRDSEMARTKLDLNKPFERASAQIHTQNTIYSTTKDGSIIYYPTGMHGAGTEGYNSPCTVLGSDELLVPGWIPTK